MDCKQTTTRFVKGKSLFDVLKLFPQILVILMFRIYFLDTQCCSVHRVIRTKYLADISVYNSFLVM